MRIISANLMLSFPFQEIKDNLDSKNADEIKQLTKDYIKYITGKDLDVVIIAIGDGSGYIRGDQRGESKKDVFVLDVMDLVKRRWRSKHQWS